MVKTFEKEEENEQQEQFLEQQDVQQQHQQQDEQQQDEQQVKNNRKDGNRVSCSISNNAKSKGEKIKKDSFLPSLGNTNSEKSFFYKKVPNEKKNNSINRSTLKKKCGCRSIVVDSKAIEQGINTWSINEKKKTFRSDHMMNRHLICLEKGDVWSKRQLIEYGFWTIIALIIQQVVGGRVGSWAFPDGKPACNTYGMSGDDGEVLKNRSICELCESVEDKKGVFIILAAFILGGFLASSMKTWLARRYAYTEICSSTRHLLINICSIVVHNEHEKKLLCRWACLGFELSVLDSRGLIDTEEAREYLDNLSLIKLDEWERMINGNRHTTIYFWIQDRVAKSAKVGHISAIEFQTLCTAITHSRDKANDLMGPISRNQPPPYIFVCASLINIHLFLTSMATGLKWAIWMYDSEDSEGLGLAVWKEPRMSFGVIVLYLYTSIYAMLFDVCTMLYNPFGPRKIDIEHFRVGGGVRALAKGLSGNEVCPETSDFDYMNVEEEEEMSVNDEEKLDRLIKQRSGEFKLASFVCTDTRQPLGISIFRNTRKARHDQKRKP
jgi:hypothetical protein